MVFEHMAFGFQSVNPARYSIAYVATWLMEKYFLIVLNFFKKNVSN